MKLISLPEYSEIDKYLQVSDSSPSGLIWIKSPPKCNWVKPGQRAGSRHKSGYWDVCFKGISYKAHRIVYLLQYKQDPGNLLVDHINGRWDNLNIRLATHSENIHYQGKKRWSTPRSSKYKGVYWSKQKNKWKVRIYVNRKQKWLGYFESELDAAKAYNEAALKYLGDFAKLNEV
jgi:hypothetical protein